MSAETKDENPFHDDFTPEDRAIQAEAALMELDAMARGELLADPVSVHSAKGRLAAAYETEDLVGLFDGRANIELHREIRRAAPAFQQWQSGC